MELQEKDDPVVMVEQTGIHQISKANKNTNANSCSDTEDEEIGECFETHANKSSSQSCSINCDNDDSQEQSDCCDENAATLFANLPITVAGGNDNEEITTASACYRRVDGTCALCLDEYAEGDIVVWSDLNCSHVFHKECLMQWLCKGKKHCPVCRNWFVPASRIADQQIAHGEAWKLALKEMTTTTK